MSPDLHHLSGAYAVDALDADERASFEQHLAECADCRAEVAELSATAHALSSITEATPPASLRDSVLSGISRVRPLPPLSEDADGPAPVVPAPSTDPTPGVTGGTGAREGTASGPAGAPSAPGAEPDAGSNVVPIRRRRTAWFAAAAAAAVITIGGLAWSPWSDDTGSQTPLAQVAAAADAQRVGSTKDGVTTEVVYSRQLGKAAISVKGLPPAPDGKTYQLWYIGAGGAITSAGLFGVDADGSGQALLAGQAAPTDKVAVSVEPAGGSTQPTTDPVVVLALA
jgi:anti-sigma-K factor RskA